MTNETQLRNRGSIGSMLKPDPNEPDRRYAQPGSETSVRRAVREEEERGRRVPPTSVRRRTG